MIVGMYTEKAIDSLDRTAPDITDLIVGMYTDKAIENLDRTAPDTSIKVASNLL